MAEQKFPRRFGRYILLDKVNAGGMAEVYRAKVGGADNFQRIVAIKCMLGSLADDPEFATMFIDEARLAAQLNHGNIVQIYELGRHEQRLYIAMELVNGHDVRNTTKRARTLGKRLGVGFVAYIMAKAAEALDYAHNKLSLEGTPLNLVHRDVSPQNILVSYDGEVKMVDFGIAKAEHRATETRAGTLKGKFAYMAPEQVTGGTIDRRADIFAMGAVLYEAATGRPLFYGDTDLAILEKVREASLPNLEEHLSHAPAQLCKVIRKACSLDPAGRYQSALDMAEDLSPLLISRGNLFGPKNARTTMRVLYEEEWNALPFKLNEYAAIDIPEEPLTPARTQVFGALLHSTGEVPAEDVGAPAPVGTDHGVTPSAINAATTAVFSSEPLEAHESSVVERSQRVEEKGEGDGNTEVSSVVRFDQASEGAPTEALDLSKIAYSGTARLEAKPRASQRTRPEPSVRALRPTTHRVLTELQAAPAQLRWTLLCLGGACVLMLVALVVVLVSKKNNDAADPPGVTAEPLVKPITGR